MVMTNKVEQSVYEKPAELFMKSYAACMRLLYRSRDGNDDIAEHKRRGMTGSRKSY